MAWKIVATRLGRHTGPGSLEVSCGVLDIIRDGGHFRRIVTDVGHGAHTSSDGTKQDILPDLSFFKNGPPIDEVRLTHMHLDHAGAVPLLLPYLAPSARVYATKMSAALMPTVLGETLKIAERTGEEPLYSAAEYQQILNRTEIIHRPGVIETVPGIPTYVHPAGHMPGACSFTTLVRGLNFHYAGDRCTHDQPGTRGATPLPREWREDCIVLGCDCTYGADHMSDSRDREQELVRLVGIISRTVSRGGIALVQSFATRGASIAAELQKYHLPDVAQVYLDGSIRVFAALQGDRGFHWCDGDSAPRIDAIRKIEAITKSEAVGREPGRKERASDAAHRWGLIEGKDGFAMLATGGMGGGISRFWYKTVLEDPSSAVIATGYAAPDTDVDRLIRASAEREVQGSARIKFHEEYVQRNHKTGASKMVINEPEYDLKCEVHQVRLGAHESRSGILDWFREEMKPIATVLNHGSPASLESLANELRGTPGMLDGGVFRCDEQPSVEFDL